MKIHYMSDLHLEFQDLRYPQCDADLLILAGDIHVGDRGIEWITRQAPTDIPILYVLGNHEYYWNDYPDLVDKLKRKSEGFDIHVLERDVFQYKGVNFFGCSLWTDFELYGDIEEAMAKSGNSLNDYVYIRNSETGVNLTPEDTRIDFQLSIKWLDNQLTQHAGETNVVITHHGPSLQSVQDKYKDHPVTAAFVSNLEDFILKHQPAHWVHGHIHSSAEYNIGECAVHANPRGYPSERESNFTANACFDVPAQVISK